MHVASIEQYSHTVCKITQAKAKSPWLQLYLTHCHWLKQGVILDWSCWQVWKKLNIYVTSRLTWLFLTNLLHALERVLSLGKLWHKTRWSQSPTSQTRMSSLLLLGVVQVFTGGSIFKLHWSIFTLSFFQLTLSMCAASIQQISVIMVICVC